MGSRRRKLGSTDVGEACAVNMRYERYDVKVDRSTKWGNQFRIGLHGDRDTVCDLYEQWFWTQPDLIAALPELVGKRLGCWCAPLRCHADFLARLANEVARNMA